MTGDGSKVQYFKEQYCIETWNVSSMNQGKLEVIKQETARVNIDILGRGELKWTGMGEFISDDYYIYCCGQESLRRNGVAIIVNNRVQNAVLGCSLKNDRLISVHFQGKPFNIRIIQVYAPTSKAENAEFEQFYEDLQDLLELTPRKDVLFIIGDWNALGKTRDLFKKIRDTKGMFHVKIGTIKDRNGMYLTEAEDLKQRWQQYTE